MTFIHLHIRTPRWVWRVAFIALCFLGGYAIGWFGGWFGTVLLPALFVR